MSITKKLFEETLRTTPIETRPLVWKGRVIPGYWVSDLGHVFTDTRELSQWKIKGRNYVGIWIDGNRCSYRVDYIVAYTYLGMYEDAIRLIHIDNDITNDRASNLMWFRKCDVLNQYKDLAIIEPDGTIREEWRDCITEYNMNLHYQVSNLGAIRDSNGNLVNIYDSYGYRVFYYIDAKNKTTRYKAVHRAVAEAFIPNPNHYSIVNHLDGNKLNDIAINLEWASSSMNAEHAYLQNLNRGVDYLVDQITNVCKLLCQNVPHTQIEMMTGVDRKTVSDIYRRRRHTNISKRYFDKFPEKKWTAEKKQLIRNAIISGKKGKEISVEIGVDYDQPFISLYERTRRELKAERLIG